MKNGLRDNSDSFSVLLFEGVGYFNEAFRGLFEVPPLNLLLGFWISALLKRVIMLYWYIVKYYVLSFVLL